MKSLNEILETIEQAANSITEEDHGVTVMFNKESAFVFVEEIRSMMKTLDFYEMDDAMDSMDMMFEDKMERDA